MSLTGSLQWGIRQFAQLDNHMTSVERVLEYTNVPQEAALESTQGNIHYYSTTLLDRLIVIGTYKLQILF